MTELIQNSKEWYAWRRSGIGASDANIIMNQSKFKTVHQLYLEKISTDEIIEETGFIQEKGHETERVARSLYELETFLSWPPILAEWSENNRIRASLDGYNELINTAWECKLMGKDMFSDLKDGIMPEIYKPQLMHQLMVTGAVETRLTGVWENTETKESESHTITIQPDIDYINSSLLPALEKFLFWVDNKIEPPRGDDDSVVVEESELMCNLYYYFDSIEEQKKLKTESDKLKKQIFAKTKTIHTNVLCGDYKIRKNRITRVKK